MRLYNPHAEILSDGEPHYEGAVLSIDAQGEETFETEALRYARYGIRRIIFSGVGSANVTATLKVGRRVTEWADVHVQAITSLLNQSEYEPGLPIEVPAGETFQLVVRNRSRSGQDIQVLVELMEPGLLEERHESVRAHVGSLPEVRYAYAFEEVPAGTTEQRLDTQSPPGRWVYDDYATFFLPKTGSISGKDVLIKQSQGNETLLEPTRGRGQLGQPQAQLLAPSPAPGFEGFNENRQLPAPVPVREKDPIRLRVTNDSNSAIVASMLVPLVSAEELPFTLDP